MLRFVMRHSLVRLIGGRAVPALLVWDALVLANRARRIPLVDRGLRRGAGLARRGLGSVASSRPTLPLAYRPSIPRQRRTGRRRRDPDA
jgi:hypothetical protein